MNFHFEFTLQLAISKQLEGCHMRNATLTREELHELAAITHAAEAKIPYAYNEFLVATLIEKGMVRTVDRVLGPTDFGRHALKGAVSQSPRRGRLRPMMSARAT